MNKEELLKLTVPKLREEALKIEGVVGVHGMRKAQLQELLAEHFGIELEEKIKHEVSTAQLKAKIRDLKAAQVEARKSGNKKQVEIIRKRKKRLKRMTRKM